MKANKDSGSLPDEVKECSHDEAYRAARTETYSGVKHQTCGKCGAGLWVHGDSTFVTLKQPNVVDFTYVCADCGDRFEYPSLVDEHRCK